MKYENNRREYRFGKIDGESLLPSPFQQFERWMEEAVAADISDPTAMTVTTVSASQEPWTRIVLMKGFSEEGFAFYTGLDSNKAHDIAANNNVVVHFPWLAMDRQVIAGGTANPIPAEDSARYFASRPRESQLAAWVATQSEAVPSREFLDQQYAEISERFADKEVTMPPNWGGFRIAPRRWEFWQGGEFRLHDRFVYERDTDGWSITRLAP